MIGASRLISGSLDTARRILRQHSQIRLIWPVSGVLRFAAGDLQSLATFLWQLRIALEDDGLSASIGVISRSESYDADQERIEKEVRGQKDAKAQSCSLVTLPFLAPCGIQPHLAANHWAPSKDENGRRALRSWQSKLREERNQQERREPIEKLNLGKRQLPQKFEDLVVSPSDSYIAIVKADVDGLGRLLAGLKFDQFATDQNLSPDEAGRQFSEHLTDCIRDAVEEALTYYASQPGKFHPFLPLILAGDDLLILARRDIALELACRIGQNYAKYSNRDPFLTQARQLAGAGELTLSMGVLFAKQGFPFDAGFELAEQLIRSAKEARKNLPAGHTEGCIDYHWLASSGRETIAESRRQGEAYVDDEKAFHLCTRPWTLSHLGEALKGAEKLAGFPRRKLKQLDAILRLGEGFSQLAYEAWWARLDQEERQAFHDADAQIRINDDETAGPPQLWRNGQNWFLELAQILEITQKGSADDKL